MPHNPKGRGKVRFQVMGKEVLMLGNMSLAGASDIERHKSNTLTGSWLGIPDENLLLGVRHLLLTMYPEGAMLDRGIHLLGLIKCSRFIQRPAGDRFFFPCLRRASQLSLRYSDSADPSKVGQPQTPPSAIRSLCSVFCGLDATPTLKQNWAVLSTRAVPYVSTVSLNDASAAPAPPPPCCHFCSSVWVCSPHSISLETF